MRQENQDKDNENLYYIVLAASFQTWRFKALFSIQIKQTAFIRFSLRSVMYEPSSTPQQINPIMVTWCTYFELETERGFLEFNWFYDFDKNLIWYWLLHYSYSRLYAIHLAF